MASSGTKEEPIEPIARVVEDVDGGELVIEPVAKRTECDHRPLLPLLRREVHPVRRAVRDHCGCGVRCRNDDAVQLRGAGTFGAKKVIKMMEGKWNHDEKIWTLPSSVWKRAKKSLLAQGFKVKDTHERKTYYKPREIRPFEDTIDAGDIDCSDNDEDDDDDADDTSSLSNVEIDSSIIMSPCASERRE